MARASSQASPRRAPGLKALRTARKQHKSLSVSETLTFQSLGGGPAASQTRTINVKLK
jgi:hypothetical protein